MRTDPHVDARVTHRFDSPPERVFDAWLDQEMIARFMFGTEDVVRMSLDARVGGRFSFVVRRQGQEFDHIGTYLEIERPRHLAFTWGVKQDTGDTSRLILDITPVEDGCEITLIHRMEPEWADFVSHSEQAWGRMLDALAAALA